MRQQLKDYLTFSRSERRGIIFLSVLILIVILIRIFYPVIYKEKEKFTEDRFIHEIAAWKDSISKTADLNESEPDISHDVHTLFDFDPNKISYDEMERLGLPPNVCKAWTNFRISGGKFYTDSDLLKIYGIDDIIFNDLKSHIKIPAPVSNPVKEPENKNLAFEKLEINTATKEQFEKLKGIGPVLSQRIVNYRNLLGGFMETGQLSEVYGIEDSLVDKIYDRLTVDNSVVRRMNINKVNERTLSKHPYISFYDARAIIKFRKIVGNFSSVTELKYNKVIPDSVYDKVYEYFEIVSD